MKNDSTTECPRWTGTKGKAALLRGGSPAARRAVGILAIAAFTLLNGYAFGASQGSAVKWRTGSDFLGHLQSAAGGASWASTVPLREAVHDLARGERVCVWLDRRIDPSSGIDFSSDGPTLDITLRRVAARLGAGIGITHSVVYIGPQPMAKNLATLIALRVEEAGAVPPPARDALRTSLEWQWPDLATPRELIEDAARSSRVRIEGIEQIPHDLWAARTLPPLSLVERLSLVLAGFDLTFEISPDGKSLRLVKAPAEAILERTYTPRGDAERTIRELAKAVPQARIQRKGARVLVSASAEDHLVVEQLLRGDRVQRASIDPANVRYTLTVKGQPLGAILERIASVGVKLEIDPRLQPRLGDPVTLRVENATLDELLRATLQNRGIRYRLAGRSLKLAPEE